MTTPVTEALKEAADALSWIGRNEFRVQPDEAGPGGSGRKSWDRTMSETITFARKKAADALAVLATCDQPLEREYTDAEILAAVVPADLLEAETARHAAPAPEGGAVSIWSDARNVFVRYAELFAMTERYEEASAIADKAAREIEALATREEAPAEAGVVQRVMNRADLTNATTPGHADAYLDALLDYTAGFYGEAREAGMPAASVADAMNHVERAARGLHALALRAQPPAREEAQPVAWSFELATVRDRETGEYSSWGEPRLSFTKPCVPEGSIRNLTALGPIAHPATDALRVAVEALERIATVDMGGGFLGAQACRQVATEALAALQAEGGAS